MNEAIGSLILLASVVTTCLFESALVRSVQSFEEGRSVAVSLQSPSALTKSEGELVHFSGLITTTEEPPNIKIPSIEQQLRLSPFVLDPTFGIAAKGVRLHRHVQMLQWVETSHTSMSSTPEDEDQRIDDDRERIYMYDLRWREEVVDSSGFDDISHWNPPEKAWIYKSLVVKAPRLVVGEFSLPDELVDQIQRRDPVSLDAGNRRVMANLLDQRQGEGWEAESALPNVTVEENYLYAWNKPREAVQGDLRIWFEVTPNYPVTVCAKQLSGKLMPYESATGESLFLLEDGIMTADELFDKKTSAKIRQSWFIRLFAGVLGFMGFLVLREPLLERSGPLLAGIQQHLLASSLSIALTFSVVVANWLLYRPLWAIAMWLGGWTPASILYVFQRAKRQLKAQ